MLSKLFYHFIIRRDLINKLNLTTPRDIPEITKLLIKSIIKLDWHGEDLNEDRTLSNLFVIESIVENSTDIIKVEKKTSDELEFSLNVRRFTLYRVLEKLSLLIPEFQRKEFDVFLMNSVIVNKTWKSDIKYKKEVLLSINRSENFLKQFDETKNFLVDVLLISDDCDNLNKFSLIWDSFKSYPIDNNQIHDFMLDFLESNDFYYEFFGRSFLDMRVVALLLSGFRIIEYIRRVRLYVK